MSEGEILGPRLWVVKSEIWGWVNGMSSFGIEFSHCCII